MREEHTTEAELPPFVARDWIHMSEYADWYPAFPTSITRVICHYNLVEVCFGNYCDADGDECWYSRTYAGNTALTLHELGIRACPR